MKIGEYVTTQEISNQSACRWVVLVDIKEGVYNSVEGGIIRYISDTKRDAGHIAAQLNLSGTEAVLICGALESLSVGGVFVE